VALGAKDLEPRTRLLFHGPSGNGKTSCAAALATSLGKAAYVVSLSALVQSYMGTTGANITKLFKLLHAGHCVVLDEVDAVGGARGGHDAADRERALTVNVLLTELDACQGGLLIATTNRPDILDGALLRRFDERVEFPAPTRAQLHELASRLRMRFGLPGPAMSWGPEITSYDAVTKAIKRAARAAALFELEISDVTAPS